jgi:hypothetical protein
MRKPKPKQKLDKKRGRGRPQKGFPPQFDMNPEEIAKGLLDVPLVDPEKALKREKKAIKETAGHDTEIIEIEVDNQKNPSKKIKKKTLKLKL